MFRFERTTDPELIRSIAAHPRIYEHLHDDFAPPREQWRPTIHPLISYMVAYEDDQLIGLFIVNAHSCVLWELHECFLPRVWGTGKPLQCANEFRKWIWRESNCLRMFGQILASNKSALRLALKAGMTEFGVHPRSFMKNGIMQDQILVGIDRPRKEE